MALSTRNKRMCGKATMIPMSDIMKQKVEQMAINQGMDQTKFTNKNKGIESPKMDWIPGMDHNSCMHDNEDDGDMDDEDVQHPASQTIQHETLCADEGVSE